jgi:hypothetical protein
MNLTLNLHHVLFQTLDVTYLANPFFSLQLFFLLKAGLKITISALLGQLLNSQVAGNMLLFGTFAYLALLLIGFLAGNEVVVDEVVLVQYEKVDGLHRSSGTSRRVIGLWRWRRRWATEG